MGFNPDQYLAEKQTAFDPDKYLAQKTVGNTQSSQGSGQAALEHFGNAAAMGYLPQLQALAEKPMTYALNAMTGNHVTPDDYVQARDANVARLAQESKDHPIASTAGGIAGTVASSVPIGKALAAGPVLSELAGASAPYSASLAQKGAAISSRLAATVLGSAAQGAAYNPGETQGEVSPLQLDARAKGAMFNGLMAAPLGVVGEAAPSIGRGLAKVGEAISGAPEKDIVTYATKLPQVNQVLKDAEGKVPQIADTIRQGYQNSLGTTRQAMNSAISAAEEGAGKDATVSIGPMIDALDKAQSKLHPHLDASEISRIVELKDALKASADEAGNVSPDSLVKMTKSLQGKADSSYGGSAYSPSPSGAQMGKMSAQAAKNAASEALQLRNENIPGVVAPFQKLSEINQVADESNPNLFIPGKPDSALFSAGAGKNERSAEILRRMGDLTGTNMLEQAQLGSAARTFANPALTPTDTTGKSFYRGMLGLAGGAEAAGILGYPVELGAKLGAAMASPAALKLGINTVRPLIAPPAELISNYPNLIPQLLRENEAQNTAIERRLKK